MFSVEEFSHALPLYEPSFSWVRGPRVALEWCPTPEGPWVSARENNLFVTLRLIEYDEDGETIWSIKEQECVLVSAKHRADTSLERALAYVAGWRAALEEILTAPPGPSVDHWMPADLIFPQVLALRTAHTVADFRARLLVRSRLGKLALPRG